MAKNNKAFTLIELIVVMAIIAVLVLLAAPRFLGYTKDANVAAMQQDTKVLADAVEMYHIDKNEWPVTGDAITDHGIGGVDGLYPIEESKLQGSIKNIKGDYSDYGIVTEGRQTGTVIHIEGVVDRFGITQYHSKPKAPTVESGLDDTTTAPGPKTLLAGTMDAGFFGEVPVEELWSGDKLAEEVGITEGISQFSDEPWLKFAIDGKIIFKAKKSYRHSISWDHINNKGAVDGSKRIKKDGNTYKVRLMKGYNSSIDMSNLKNINHGSEWNRLMLPINVKVKNQNWVYKGNVELGNIPDWTVNIKEGEGYTDGDLNVNYYHHRNGSYQWMQDVAIDKNKRVCRGFHGISTSSEYMHDDIHPDRGWSPVLEYVK